MKRYIYILFLFNIMSLSCTDNYIETAGEEELVVEGWIKDEGYPVVMLMTSVQVDMQNHPTQELYDHIGNWGRVVVSDGDTTVMLTGMYDASYYPPYIYTTTGIKGASGKTYTLDAVFRNHHVMATTTIPNTVKLDSITQVKVEDSDTLWTLLAHFTDPPGEHFYNIFYKIGTTEQQFIKSDVGTFDNSAVNPDRTCSKAVSYPVYQTSSLLKTQDVTEYFTRGDTVCVELCTMDSISFNIWQDYQNIKSLSGNMFVPYTESIRTNIKGGYGYWCGYGASRRWTIVGENE